MVSQPSPTPAALCRARIAKIERKADQTRCLLANGMEVLASPFLGPHLNVGDQLSFPLSTEVGDAGTEIYVGRHSTPQRRGDIYQTHIGYVTQPKADKREEQFVTAEVSDGNLGISSIRIACEDLRDYFYAADRGVTWGAQRTFYQLLQAPVAASPSELRLAFKLRHLELRASGAANAEFLAIERAFNILAHRDWRACYDALLRDPASPAVFPYGGFGSILVTGERSQTSDMFFAGRIIAYLPERRRRRFHAPLRNCEFLEDRALYRDPRRKIEVWLDPALLPLIWDASWNRWKHLLAAKFQVEGVFLQGGKYRRAGVHWELRNWETALPSRLKVTVPSDIHLQIERAKRAYERFGEYTDALERVRGDINRVPIEKTALQRICGDLGIPGDFDVAQITWRPDYDLFFYEQLSRLARTVYLFRNEYIFDLENAVIVETPQLGHATYRFAKPKNIAAFLADYSRTTKSDILHNRNNSATKLGYLGRIVHGADSRAWLSEINQGVGEKADSAPYA